MGQDTAQDRNDCAIQEGTNSCRCLKYKSTNSNKYNTRRRWKMNVTNSFTEPHHTTHVQTREGKKAHTVTHTHTHTPEKKQHSSIPHTKQENNNHKRAAEWNWQERKKENDT